MTGLRANGISARRSGNGASYLSKKCGQESSSLTQLLKKIVNKLVPAEAATATDAAATKASLSISKEEITGRLERMEAEQEETDKVLEEMRNNTNTILSLLQAQAQAREQNSL